MKENPILMNGEMVRATLRDIDPKTQTRRVVTGMALDWLQPGGFSPEYVASPNSLLSPYGFAGDRLWIRETCRAEELPDGLDGVRYLADGSFRPIENSIEAADRWIDLNAYRGKRGAVVPSIHMPRWASRIIPEVTALRIERLQDISEDDAIAEGIDGSMCAAAVGRAPSRATLLPAAVHGFAHLWDGLNAARGYGWNANPWVWVVEFRRIGA